MELIARKLRNGLSGIEDKGNARPVQLLGMLLHGLLAIRRNDGHRGARVERHGVEVGLGHGARVKGRELVLAPVRHDHALCGVAVRQHGNMVCGDAELAQPFEVVAAILADRGHRNRLSAELLDGIGHVGSTSPEVAAHARRQEGDIELVDLIGEDMVGKVAVEFHEHVEGHGAGNQNRHGAGRKEKETGAAQPSQG